MTPQADRKQSFLGLRKIGIAIPIMFIGPVIIYSAFKNKLHPLYYVVLGVGILLCLFSMLWFFKGLLQLVNGLFNDKNNQQ